MEEQKQEENWQEVKGNSEIWLPEIGDHIEGEVLALKDGIYGLQATIGKDDDKWVTPSHKVLQNRLNELAVGDYVRITLVKEELPTIKGNNKTKIYKVEKKVIPSEKVE